MGIYDSINMSQEDRKKFEIIKEFYNKEYGKQSIVSSIRLLINEKYQSIQNKNHE